MLNLLTGRDTASAILILAVVIASGFFHSFRKDGLPMNLMAVGLVLLAVLTTYIIHLVSGENLGIMTGIEDAASGIASAYAVAYPLGDEDGLLQDMRPSCRRNY